MSKEWIAQDSPKQIEKTISYMTPNRCIFLNIIATYGRSLYALVCGVFVSRWMSAAEKSEFGVCGVVGGMMVIVILACAMRRGRVVFAAGDRQ